MTDCILYGRVSTDKQDMQRQERMFVDYCHRNQLHSVLTLLDEDTSGSIPFREREQGSRLFPEIQNRIRFARIEVVTTEQDRIGRDTLDIIANIRAFWQLGAVPHFTAEVRSAAAYARKRAAHGEGQCRAIRAEQDPPAHPV